MLSIELQEIYASVAKAQTAISFEGGALFEDDERSERRRTLFRLRKVAGEVLGNEGVCRCGRYVSFAGRDDRSGSAWAMVMSSPKGAYFSQVISCHSVWHCPVCGSRIAAERRSEVSHAVGQHMRTGGHVWMSVMTVPHMRASNCRELRQGISKAFQKIIAGRSWMAMKEKLGLVGFVRALEVTHGKNGWHPHLHVLWFVDCHPRMMHDFREWLSLRWQSVVETVGLGEAHEKAASVEFAYHAEDAAGYVSKAGIDWEVTSGIYKKARGESRSPWKILHDYMDDQWWPDAELFKEYAEAFKGARQLTWSRGLKALYGVAERADEDIKEDGADKALPICLISEDVLGRMYRQQVMPDFLVSVEKFGFSGARDFIGSRYGLCHVRPVGEGLTPSFFMPNVSNIVVDLIPDAIRQTVKVKDPTWGMTDEEFRRRNRRVVQQIRNEKRRKENDDEGLSGNW